MWILCSFIGEAMKKRAHIPHNFEMTFETCQYISSGEREKRKQAFSKTQDCETGKTEEMDI